MLTQAQPQTPFTITNREYDVLLLICSGLTIKEISQELFLSAETVRTHKKKLFLKLDVHSLTQLVVKAIRVGLVDVGVIE